MLKSQILMKDLHIRSAKNSTQQTTSSAVTAVHLSPMIKNLFLTISSITQSKKIWAIPISSDAIAPGRTS